MIQSMPLIVVKPIEKANRLIQDRFISHVHLGQGCITKETVNDVSTMSSLTKFALKLLDGITEQILMSNLFVQKFNKVFDVVNSHKLFVHLVEKPITLIDLLLQL